VPPDSFDRYEIGRKELGRSIRRRRTELGLTMRVLAERADMNFNSIVSLELGRAMPSLRSLDVIASALETTSTQLLHDVFPWDGGEPSLE
jgi:transcriptional regulator with XRE-family HTH domain